MTGNFPRCLDFTLAREGGFSNDPRDDGGATNEGITLRTFGYYFPRPTVEQLKRITPDQVRLIYEAGFWRETYGDELPRGLDLMVFDMGVTTGPFTAVAMLQELLGVEADGDVGEETLGAIGKHSLTGLIANLAQNQRAYYRSLDKPTFIEGWLRRVELRVIESLKMTGATKIA
jgi:lysozyme family protein